MEAEIYYSYILIFQVRYIFQLTMLNSNVRYCNKLGLIGTTTLVKLDLRATNLGGHGRAVPNVYIYS